MTENHWYSSSQLNNALTHSLPDAVHLGNLTDKINPKVTGKMGGKTVISCPITHTGEQSMLTRLVSLLEQIQKEKVPPKAVLIPIFATDGPGDHWTSLAIFPDAEKPGNARVAYVNSKGFDNYGEDKKIVSIVERMFNTKVITNSKNTFQPDGHSCGPITVETLKGLAKDEISLKEIENAAYEKSWQLSGKRKVSKIRADQVPLLSEVPIKTPGPEAPKPTAEPPVRPPPEPPPPPRREPSKRPGGASGKPRIEPPAAAGKLPWKTIGLTVLLGAVVIGGAGLLLWNQDQERKRGQNGQGAPARGMA